MAWQHVAFVLANAGHPATGSAYSQTYVNGAQVGLEDEVPWNNFDIGNQTGQLIIGGHSESAGTS